MNTLSQGAYWSGATSLKINRLVKNNNSSTSDQSLSRLMEDTEVIWIANTAFARSVITTGGIVRQHLEEAYPTHLDNLNEIYQLFKKYISQKSHRETENLNTPY